MTDDEIAEFIGFVPGSEIQRYKPFFLGFLVEKFGEEELDHWCYRVGSAEYDVFKLYRENEGELWAQCYMYGGGEIERYPSKKDFAAKEWERILEASNQLRVKWNQEKMLYPKFRDIE